MTSLHRALLAVGAAGALMTGLAVAFVLSSEHVGDHPAVDAAIFGGVMAAYIGTGLFAWWRRPDNRIGPLMTAVGFLFFFNALVTADGSLLFTIGTVLSSLYLAVAVHMLLAFPSGHLPSRAQRRLLAAVYALSVGIPGSFVLFSPDCGCPAAADHPANAFLVSDQPAVATAIDTVGSAVAIGIIAVIVVILVRRWRASPRAGRRTLAPVLLTGAVMTAVIAALLAVDVVAQDTDAVAIVNLAGLITFAALPFAFLAGLVRSRSWRAGAISEVVHALGTGRLRDALAEALGDPSLELAYWLPDAGRHVDAEGRPVHVPDRAEAGRAATGVEREGRRIGAIVHDAVLCDEPDLVRTVGAAAALAMENERLEAELRARVEELHRSRERLLAAGLEERRRLERDLHDGAQQRLVALSLQLGLVSSRLERDPGAARELLEGARAEARSALEDLRELARGIHPAVLTDRGLGPALEALADRAPVPVEVAAVPAERLPSPVEAAAYFVVAESLTNVAKYAQASHTRVSVGRENGFVLVDVRDDGVGGADPAAGSGLRGLADRVAALDGRLEIDSAAGRGTTVRARMPCRS